MGVSIQFLELDYTNVKKKCLYTNHEEWREELLSFHKKTEYFWHLLQFRTMVSPLVVSNILRSFEFSSLFKTRKLNDLDNFAPFW